MMNVLLVSSVRDRDMVQALERALAAAGHTPAILSPDQDGEITLAAHTRQVAQAADCFIYLVTRYSQAGGWLSQLTPEGVAPLCAAGLRILLLVANQGSLPAGLAYLPNLYLLDDPLAPALIERLPEMLGLVHDLPPEQVELLRYGLEDLEEFLETAQALSFAYTDIESSWSELAVFPGSEAHSQQIAQALCQRYAADSGQAIRFRPHARLEQRIREQASGGLAERILSEYQALERDWLAIQHNFSAGAGLPPGLLQARTRAAILINLVYLVLTCKLLPYCDQYLHMYGLKQHQELPSSTAQPGDPAEARLAFLLDHLH